MFWVDFSSIVEEVDMDIGWEPRTGLGSGLSFATNSQKGPGQAFFSLWTSVSSSAKCRGFD